MEMLAESIGSFRHALDPETCKQLCWIFDKKEASGIRENGGIEPTNNESFGGLTWRDDQKRKDISLDITHYHSMKDYAAELEQVLFECSREYFRYFQSKQKDYRFTYDGIYSREGWNPEKQPMDYKMQKTHPNGGFSLWHHEQGKGPFDRGRYAVWMIYLNDVTEGGGTDFPAQDLTVQPTEGTLVIWPAAFTHPHRSAPDLKQTKYIITGWFLHEPVEGELNEPESERHHPRNHG